VVGANVTMMVQRALGNNTVGQLEDSVNSPEAEMLLMVNDPFRLLVKVTAREEVVLMTEFPNDRLIGLST
jgi:hypothetical protein